MEKGEKQVNDGKLEKKYPTVLDVVDWKKKEYQVVGVARMGKDDFYLLYDLDSEKPLIRVKGASFEPVEKRDPGKGRVYRKDDRRRVTGKLIGGEVE